MQPKFKKGDKIRCIEESSAVGVEVGGIYTVKNPLYRSNSKGVCIEIEEVETAIPYQSRFELVEEAVKTKEQPKTNYREMSPDTLVKVFIDGISAEIPLGDLIRAKAVLGTTNGYWGYDFYKLIGDVIDQQQVVSEEFGINYVIDWVKHEDRVLDKYFQPSKVERGKSKLWKDIETQKSILETQTALLKALEDKYNSL